eukprot:4413567-Pleurochrysis_carterae.AAC.1
MVKLLSEISSVKLFADQRQHPLEQAAANAGTGKGASMRSSGSLRSPCSLSKCSRRSTGTDIELERTTARICLKVK